MPAETSVWAYLVVSSDGQEDTLPRQRAWAQDEADRKGWRLEHVEQGVASGKAGVRSTFSDLIAKLEACAPDARPAWVLMTRLDRIGRGLAADSMIALQRVRKLGPGIWVRGEGERKLDTAADEMVANVILGVSRIEKEVREDKARSVYVARRKARESDPRRAITSKGPYGTRYEGGYLVPQEPEAEAVRLMFRMRIEQHSCYSIGRKLLEMAPPIVQKNGKTRRLSWDHDLVPKLLRKQAYVDAGLVSEVDFQKAQLVKSPRGGSQARIASWPFSGVLHCVCGNPLQGLISGRSKSRNRYYVCPDRRHAHGKHMLHRLELIERQWWQLLAVIGLQLDFADDAADKATERDLLVQAIQRARAAEQKIQKQEEQLWEAFHAGHLRIETVQSQVDKATESRTDATAAVAKLRADLQAFDASLVSAEQRAGAYRSAASRYRAADDNGKKAVAMELAILLGAVLVREDGAFVIRGFVAEESFARHRAEVYCRCVDECSCVISTGAALA